MENHKTDLNSESWSRINQTVIVYGKYNFIFIQASMFFFLYKLLVTFWATVCGSSMLGFSNKPIYSPMVIIMISDMIRPYDSFLGKFMKTFVASDFISS